MRHDAIEIGMVSRAARRSRARQLEARRNAAAVEKSHVKAGAIDEAFAGLSTAPAATSTDESSASFASSNRSLMTQLSDQLAALDHQREQLARLLREVEATEPDAR